MRNKCLASKFLFALLGMLLTGYAVADNWQLNMYRGVTPISRDIYQLHMIAIYVCAVIGVIVFGIMIYSLIFHRKSRGYAPATFHDNKRLEIIWTAIPFFILIALAIPATRVLVHMEDTADSEVTIKIVGSQWKWQYQYLDQGISYFSNLSTPYKQMHNQEKKGEWYLLEVDNPLVVPVNKKIRFLVTSSDVVHSWWVPELGVKRDAIPGFMHEAWARIEKPGIYRGQCAELCGINHGFMPIVVKAVTDAEFQQWVAQQSNQPVVAVRTLSRDVLMAEGKDKYEQICAACHQSDGKGMPPMYPALRASSVAVGKSIDRHISMLLNGVSGSAMQAYKDMLSNEEIAAIVTYERNAWDNNTNDVIQPAEVQRVREGEMMKPLKVEKAQVGSIK